MIEKIFSKVIETIKKNQELSLIGVLLTLFVSILGHKYTLWSVKKGDKISDQFISITREHDNEKHIMNFNKKYSKTIYANLLNLKQANAYYERGDTDQCVKVLKDVYKSSNVTTIKSIAAYRIANILKDSNPKQSLKYAEKIETHSLRPMKSLIKASAFENMNENEKALIEINSILSSNSVREKQIMDNKIIIELANQHKRRLLNKNGTL